MSYIIGVAIAFVILRDVMADVAQNHSHSAMVFARDSNGAMEHGGMDA